MIVNLGPGYLCVVFEYRERAVKFQVKPLNNSTALVSELHNMHPERVPTYTDTRKHNKVHYFHIFICIMFAFFSGAELR